MIYWPTTADEFDAYIPNALAYEPQDGDPTPFLAVRNNVGLDVISADFVFDGVTPLYFFAHFTNWDAGLTPGEYTYRLTLGGDGKVLSEGLLIVGDYQPAENIQYDKPTTYEQYDPNASASDNA